QRSVVIAWAPVPMPSGISIWAVPTLPSVSPATVSPPTETEKSSHPPVSWVTVTVVPGGPNAGERFGGDAGTGPSSGWLGSVVGPVAVVGPPCGDAVDPGSTSARRSGSPTVPG